MDRPTETSAHIKADLAALGLSSFHTKYIIIPKSGIQQKERMLIAIFGVSSGDAFCTRTPHFGQISACAAISSLQ